MRAAKVRKAGPNVATAAFACSAIPRLTRHAPDHVTHIICDQQRAVRANGNAHRSSVGRPLVWGKKASQNITRRSSWASILEGHKDDFIAAQFATIPRTVLTDNHAVGKAGQCVGW